MFAKAKKGIVLAALLCSTSAFAATPDWKVSELSGTVTIERGGKAVSAREDSKLLPGDVIRTGTKGRAVLVRGKEFVVVSPNAHLKVAVPEETGAVTQFFQYLGNVLFKIEKKSTPHFGVETPYLAAVVKGTTFNVSVNGERSSVQVTEGVVEVATGDDLEAALLTPGLIGIVDADQISDLVVITGDRSDEDMSGVVVRGTPSFTPKLPATFSGARLERGEPSGRGVGGSRGHGQQGRMAQPIAAGLFDAEVSGGELQAATFASERGDDQGSAEALFDSGGSGGASAEEAITPVVEPEVEPDPVVIDEQGSDDSSNDEPVVAVLDPTGSDGGLQDAAPDLAVPDTGDDDGLNGEDEDDDEGGQERGSVIDEPDLGEFVAGVGSGPTDDASDVPVVIGDDDDVVQIVDLGDDVADDDDRLCIGQLCFDLRDDDDLEGNDENQDGDGRACGLVVCVEGRDDDDGSDGDVDVDVGADLGVGDDDGNNGLGNDPGGVDPSNPGQGNGNGPGDNGNGSGDDDDDDIDVGIDLGLGGDGNNGHGNDPGGFDPSNPGQGNGNGNGNGKGDGPGKGGGYDDDDDDDIDIGAGLGLGLGDDDDDDDYDYDDEDDDDDDDRGRGRGGGKGHGRGGGNGNGHGHGHD